MRELTDVLEFLNEDVFSDEKQHFYICVDRLDENWVDESFRYMLIRSLIETIRDFLQVRNIKIIAALRTDLIERVFRFTRDSGFQEEKYRSLYLPLRWTRVQLLSLLDKRVNYLVQQTYTKRTVGYSDLLPTKVDKGKSAVDYLIERLSITHKFSAKGKPQLDVGQAGQTSPNDRVSGGCVAGTREIAPESRDPDQVSRD